ncbi:Undecaprenyl-phosphate N-acetylglucosaminyl 1-phosphate transferase [hydrothermal vent metagenome]|uniref:Undecaprenyl-phosphate N-acetylglucosaminyl 1-phosphate transferase n=1 Tax=hydrothermal vent metagenome TaxID=652676 RepID=A0A1W1BJ74_9ZZZZ
MSTLIISSILIISLLLTFIVKEIVLKLKILDTPNKRSSHSQPTPTLGGVAIILSFMLGITLMFYAKTIPNELFLPFVLGGGLLGLISFFDDIKPIAIKYRISLHIIIAFLTVYWLDIHLFSDWLSYHIGLSYLSIGVSAFILLLGINTVNFMDGIDGIVATQIIFVFTVITLFLINDNNIVDARYFALLVAISLGFLVFNFAPAQIFMGDVGSIFLGFIISVLLIYTVNTNSISFSVWLILLAMFWLDVVFVLIVRILNKDNITHAHKTHFYQKLTQYFSLKNSRTYAHRKTIYSITAINILWLLPLATIAEYYPEYSVISLVISLIPLLFLMWKFKAGKV